jgi:hypothetical protein
MKRILSVLFLLVFLTSCAGNAPSVPAASAAMTVTTAATGTPASPENTATATFTPEPTVTPTPVPAPARWYWGLQEGTNQLLAASQDGEIRQLGSLPASELENFKAFVLDDERALLVTVDQTRLHAYLLTPDGMQPIDLPADLVYDQEQSGYSLVVPAVHGDHALLGYTDQPSSGGSNMADRGPLLLIDLEALTASIVDTQVNHDLSSSVSETRLWAHVSEDGSQLRYLEGDREKMSVRELDLSNGQVRTVNTTTNHVTANISASLRGDLWRFAKDGLVFDLNGNQTEFTDPSLLFRPLREAKALVMPADCEDDCELKVVDPFGGEAELVYRLPWSTSYAFQNPLLYQPVSDQSLLFVGAAPVRLSNTPALMSETPALRENDRPVFRLTPDGNSRLVGIYVPEFGQDNLPVSSDGRYMLLEALDHQSFFIYDVPADRALAETAAFPELDYFWGDAAFDESGVIAHLTASTAENTYRDFFLVHSFLTGKSFSWEPEAGAYAGCEDILPDDSVVCWEYNDQQTSFNLVRYDPETQETRILLENAQFINDVR